MSEHDLAGATALVTGASRGLGRGIATALSRAGAQVVGVARDRGPLEELGAALGESFTPVSADAADPTVAGRLIDVHHPAILVLNAGASPLMRPLQHHTWETFSVNWQTDVRIAFRGPWPAALTPSDQTRQRWRNSCDHRRQDNPGDRGQPRHRPEPGRRSPQQRPQRSQDTMTDHKVVDRQEWQAARDELLQREKAHTRIADELARQRRQLPWVQVDKPYRFDTDHGPKTLPELFDGRSQLLIYHFMFGPSYQAGDPVNSSIADTLDALTPHLQARDVTPLLVSQAPLAKLQAYQQRMGWRQGWVSAAPSDFNLDLGASTPQQPGQAIVPPQPGLPPIVAQNAAAAGTDIAGYLSEAPVVSVFVLHDGVVYQSYQTTWRGVEFLMGYYPILDRMPKGRDEDQGWQLWLRRHNEYDEGVGASAG